MLQLRSSSCVFYTSGSGKERSMSRLGLFKVPGFLGVYVTYGVVSLAQYGTLQWGPVYLVNDLGHSILVGKLLVTDLAFSGV
jgi:hypothetical protein